MYLLIKNPLNVCDTFNQYFINIPVDTIIDLKNSIKFKCKYFIHASVLWARSFRYYCFLKEAYKPRHQKMLVPLVQITEVHFIQNATVLLYFWILVYLIFE